MLSTLPSQAWISLGAVASRGTSGEGEAPPGQSHRAKAPVPAPGAPQTGQKKSCLALPYSVRPQHSPVYLHEKAKGYKKASKRHQSCSKLPCAPSMQTAGARAGCTTTACPVRTNTPPIPPAIDLNQLLPPSQQDFPAILSLPCVNSYFLQDFFS